MSTLTITTIQTNLHWEDKAANLQMLEEKINSIKEKTEIVVLPEMFTTGFSMKPKELAETMDGETVQWMKRIAAAKKIILTGSVIIEDGGNYYNRLIWMTPEREYTYYDKRHLFSMGKENDHYTAGDEKVIVELKGWKIRLAICYDLRFPVWIRNQGSEYDLLLIVASWPDQRMAHWRALIPARAIENQSYVVAVNRVGHDGNQVYHSGHSMCIDPFGNTVYYKPEDEDLYTFSIGYEELVKIRRAYPFLPDADNFTIV